MMFRRIFACSVFAAAMLSFTPSPSSGASKEIQELQRDVAQLQDQLKQLQQSQDRQLAEIRVLVQQSLSAATDANKSVAVIQSGFQQNLRDQESKVVAPVVGMNTRMDQVSQEMRTVQQAVGDLTSLMSKMQAQLTDLGNAMKVMSGPAPPPPPPGRRSGDAVDRRRWSRLRRRRSRPSRRPSCTTMPTATARAGKLDLAVQEYADYLRWYGNTDLAPNAQYYIAWIHASQGDYAKRDPGVRRGAREVSGQQQDPRRDVRQGRGAEPDGPPHGRRPGVPGADPAFPVERPGEPVVHAADQHGAAVPGAGQGRAAGDEVRPRALRQEE